MASVTYQPGCTALSQHPLMGEGATSHPLSFCFCICWVLDVLFLSTSKHGRSLYWKLCRSKWWGREAQTHAEIAQNWSKIQVLPLKGPWKTNPSSSAPSPSSNAPSPSICSSAATTKCHLRGVNNQIHCCHLQTRCRHSKSPRNAAGLPVQPCCGE